MLMFSSLNEDYYFTGVLDIWYVTQFGDQDIFHERREP